VNAELTPRDYLTTRLALAEGHRLIDIEPSETVCAVCAAIPGLPDVYRTDGDWPCAEYREAVLATALLAVLDDCEWYVRVHGDDVDESTFVDGMLRRSRKTIEIITDALGDDS